MEADTTHPALPSRSPAGSPRTPLCPTTSASISLHAVGILLDYGHATLIETVRQRATAAPTSTPSPGLFRHRQPRDHPRPPQPRHPAPAGALENACSAPRAATGRRHRLRRAPHPRASTTASPSRPEPEAACPLHLSPPPRKRAFPPRRLRRSRNSSCLSPSRTWIVRCAPPPRWPHHPRYLFGSSPSSQASATAPSANQLHEDDALLRRQHPQVHARKTPPVARPSSSSRTASSAATGTG